MSATGVFAINGFPVELLGDALLSNAKHSEELLAGFGAVHLNVTNLETARKFYVEVCGFHLRKANDNSIELGTAQTSLLVVHQGAAKSVQKGYSGLYHVAIHLPTIGEFANILYRLRKLKYPHAPTDHVMSQSIYLEDPDGITLEFALETPERFKRVITEGGLQMEDASGKLHQAAGALDVEAVLLEVTDKSDKWHLPATSKIGHLHFYVTDLLETNVFYRSLGFAQFNLLPKYRYADLSAGGAYKHRIALNMWHGVDRPKTPPGNAGLKYYTLQFSERSKFIAAVHALGKKVNAGVNSLQVTDPSGNELLLTCN